jgi:hypothetical protein
MADRRRSSAGSTAAGGSTIASFLACFKRAGRPAIQASSSGRRQRTRAMPRSTGATGQMRLKLSAEI